MVYCLVITSSRHRKWYPELSILSGTFGGAVQSFPGGEVCLQTLTASKSRVAIEDGIWARACQWLLLATSSRRFLKRRPTRSLLTAPLSKVSNRQRLTPPTRLRDLSFSPIYLHTFLTVICATLSLRRSSRPILQRLPIASLPRQRSVAAGIVVPLRKLRVATAHAGHGRSDATLPLAPRVLEASIQLQKVPASSEKPAFTN